MQVKSLSKAGTKWAKNANAATSDYTDGVKSTPVNWASATGAAEGAYESGVTEAIGKKRFGSGVAAAGDSKWRNKAAVKGARNYGPGVREAQPDYEKGFKPYQEALTGITLPPRGSRGSPENLERVAVIARALHQVRVGA